MTNNQTNENFASLLDEYMSKDLEGRVVKGTVVKADDEFITLDVGLKSEGRIARREFGLANQISVGDRLDVYIDRYEDKDGNVVLSREKARREEAWKDLEVACQEGRRVQGVIFGRVKGGFTVDLDGATAFLPGSQVDVRPVRDITPLMNVPLEFMILKMDRTRGNIVASRRAILEESRTEQRSEIIRSLAEGQVVEGVVKNITDYGAFIDLGGVDGLLHVTDISWKRVNHPSEVLGVGQNIKAVIIRFNQEAGRISLGLKQLENDPWVGVSSRFSAGQKVRGRVTNVADYGAFVELEEGIEGLIHVSEMSWTKKNIHPGKILSVSQEIDAMVLEVDEVKRRISLGLKQCQDNPWKAFAESYPVGSAIEGEIKTITEFALFVNIGPDIDGMVHLSDLSYEKSGEEAVKEYAKGQMVKTKVIDIDLEKERVALGIKQLSVQGDARGSAAKTAVAAGGGVRKNDVVTCTVTEVADQGVEVEVEGFKGFIKRADLSMDRESQRPENFGRGDTIDAKVLTVDAKTRKLTLSIKAKELDEQKAALKEYGQTDDSGASLGDILGVAMAKAAAKKAAKEDKEPKQPAAAKAKAAAAPKAAPKKKAAAKKE